MCLYEALFCKKTKRIKQTNNKETIKIPHPKTTNPSLF